MSDTAFQIQYKQEFIAGFEQHQSLVRGSVTTEAVIKGYQATFLVADSGQAAAVTRGVNGLIPGRSDNLNQPTATLSEWHDKPERSGFNIFASQGDGKRIMQETSMGVINRKIDDQIITELTNATLGTGAATTASIALIMKAKTILGNNKVPFDGNITALITPAFEAYLMQLPNFSSKDWVQQQPFPGADLAWNDQMQMYKWLGINWIVHPALPGFGTNAEKCFMYHRNAIAHAAPGELIDTYVGYNEEHDYSFARTSAYMGAKLLQNSGVVVMNHDGSAFVAS